LLPVDRSEPVDYSDSLLARIIHEEHVLAQRAVSKRGIGEFEVHEAGPVEETA